MELGIGIGDWDRELPFGIILVLIEMRIRIRTRQKMKLIIFTRNYQVTAYGCVVAGLLKYEHKLSLTSILDYSCIDKHLLF